MATVTRGHVLEVCSSPDISQAAQTSALAVNASTWWLSSRKSVTGRTLGLFCCSTAIRGISPIGGFSFSSGYGTRQPLLILLPDLDYRILRHPIAQSFTCAVLWPLPCRSSGSALIVEGGREVRFINSNGCTLSYSPICMCLDGPTAMPPNAFMVSIPNNRSNPSGLPHTTNTLILAEPPFSVDTVTIPTPQNRLDMPTIVMMSTIALVHSRYQLALNIASRRHKCLHTGVLYLHLGWREGWRWCLVLCLVSPNYFKPSVQPPCICSTAFHASGSPLLRSLCHRTCNMLYWG